MLAIFEKGWRERGSRSVKTTIIKEDDFKVIITTTMTVDGANFECRTVTKYPVIPESVEILQCPGGQFNYFSKANDQHQKVVDRCQRRLELGLPMIHAS